MSAQSKVVAFGETSFDASDMPIDEIADECRLRGWLGMRIDSRELNTTGRVIVHRLSRRQVDALGCREGRGRG